MTAAVSSRIETKEQQSFAAFVQSETNWMPSANADKAQKLVARMRRAKGRESRKTKQELRSATVSQMELGYVAVSNQELSVFRRLRGRTSASFA